MKRPQSAKAKHYWAQNSHDQGQFEEHTRSHLKHNKKLINMVSASNDLSRLLPKRIVQDKERLYYQTLQLKTSLNEISDENVKLKTKVAVLEKERQKISRLQDVGLRRGGRSGLIGGPLESHKENAVVVNLKKMVRERQQQSQNLKSQLAKLKKTVRYTKINQLQQQKLTIYEQNKKLTKLIIQLQTELQDRVRNEHQVDNLASQLKTRTQELKELINQNGRYEEHIEQIEMNNKTLQEKLIVLQKKMQRDVAVEKRRVEQLTKVNEMLKNNNKVLNEKLEQQKKKQIKKVVRPASSNPYRSSQQSQVQKTNQSVVEKEQALELNNKLKKELQAAKKKLAQSESMLYEDANSYYNTGDEAFELVLTKNQAEEFIGTAPKSKENTGWVKKQKVQSKQNTKKENINNKTLDQLKEILTYRMKYNRYTFEELKEDIQSSPVQSFAVEDLMLMLTEEPFFLTKQYANEFLRLCQNSTKGIDDSISGAILIKNLRNVIQQFELVQEEQEEKMLYKIADFMTRHRNQIETEFKRFNNKGTQVTKAQIQQVLKKFKQLSQAEIDLTICYVSVTSQNLQKINYTDLMDKFLINNSKSIGSKEPVEQNPYEDDLSLGQNEDIPCYDEQDEDQII